MARMLGRRVWRGQTVEDAPLPRRHWRAREKREWREWRRETMVRIPAKWS